MEKKSLPITFLLLLLVVILIPTFVLAINTVDEGYAIPPSTGTTINAHGVCRIVYNNTTGLTYFVPTHSEAEWFAFRFHMPTGVSDAPGCGCPVSCPAKPIGLHDSCADGCGGVCPCDTGLECNGYTCEVP